MMDTKQKYVRLRDYNQVIIFSPLLDHDTFRNLNPISAGFCYVKKISLLHKYKDQKPQLFGPDFGEKMYPVTAILEMFKEIQDNV